MIHSTQVSTEMNVYLIVEGDGEKKIYTHWVPLVNPKLSVVNSLEEVQHNNLIIFSGGGYPNYLEVIEAGVEDVVGNEQLDRLVIAVDSEEMSYKEKRREIEQVVNALGKNLDYKIIVQHFCLETWALGNKVMVSRNPEDIRLRQYISYFNILNRDPELLPPIENLSRSQFAARYLKKLLNEKYRALAYKKGNPKPLLNDMYFKRVKMILDTTGHIASFEDFLAAFV